MVLYLNKLESHSTKNALIQVWVKVSQWFWRRQIMNFVKVFSLFRKYPPRKNGALHLKKNRIPFTQGCIVPNLVKLTKWFWIRYLNFVNIFSLVINYIILLALERKTIGGPPKIIALKTVFISLVKTHWIKRCTKTNSWAVKKRLINLI